MDYSQFRRSQNVEAPEPILDPLVAMLFNPLKSQWNNPLSIDNPGGRFPQTAAEFPTFPPASQVDVRSPIANQLGIRDLARLLSGEPDYAAKARETLRPGLPPPSGDLKDY